MRARVRLKYVTKPTESTRNRAVYPVYCTVASCSATYDRHYVPYVQYKGNPPRLTIFLCSFYCIS